MKCYREHLWGHRARTHNLKHERFSIQGKYEKKREPKWKLGFRPFGAIKKLKYFKLILGAHGITVVLYLSCLLRERQQWLGVQSEWQIGSNYTGLHKGSAPTPSCLQRADGWWCQVQRSAVLTDDTGVRGESGEKTLGPWTEATLSRPAAHRPFGSGGEWTFVGFWFFHSWTSQSLRPLTSNLTDRDVTAFKKREREKIFPCAHKVQ